MGCAQSKDDNSQNQQRIVSPTKPSNKNSQQVEILGIGRTERMIHREQNKGAARSRPSNHSGVSATSNESTSSSSKDSKSQLKNHLKMSIRERNNGSMKGPELDPITGNLVPSEVIRRRERSVKVNSTSIMLDGSVTIEYAYCTQRGYYPDDPHKPNQDAYSITHNFCSIAEDSFFAVYDGHGPVGEHFAQYAKANLPKLITKHFKQEQIQAHKEKNASLASNEKIPFNPKFFPKLDHKQYEEACKRAHVECNQNMIDTQPLVNLSGTTVIGAGFHNGHLIISNLGDSRAILGYRDEEVEGEEASSRHGKIVAVPLSQDQTPWRKDERQRIVKAGGRVMTIDQMDGKVPIDDTDNDQDRKLGEDEFIDEKGDPPRVWLADKNLPGTSFTRSLGDSTANQVGVFAEPEFFSKPITDQDEILVLASDGVFEFLQNQEIIDICTQHSDDPVTACEQVVDAAYKKWLDYENRTDDITVIILFFRRQNDKEEKDGQMDVSDTESTKELGSNQGWSLKNSLLGIVS
mmetsp:Transcript_9638/g.18088  ORF Transcript_9638/g.18088 Transcript_9638/m.18088 type:complete len:520 (-) Transcript_9638:365-1924(-)|eukprot:CAMPEP_0176485322 /NCGR_PEP_ID=MMETSP0200_2-20121128/4978_1 /TAXON_ID=947934 /ORGANISM="Chaetoceros sp., Strain GSL56" /LENGTH=519 /DNA_ID=CAMNT_0017881959 /DNA_START=165 /DNA_END=1724 /DNA_ORIENTATION=-